jgi:hypothetical protein
MESRTLLTGGAELVGYLPDWEFSRFNNIDLGALTRLNYFAVAANADGSLATTSSSGRSFDQLRTVVAAAHAATPPVPVSIVVDWHTPFVAIAQSPTASNAFVNNLVSFCSTYQLDGVDLDFEPDAGTLTPTQKDAYGRLLSALHAQTSSRGLLLSAAVQASQKIIPQAYLSDVDRYYVMDYDLAFNDAAPYDASVSYLESWADYGVPKAKLLMGVPFYGKSGTSWADSQSLSYASILSGYAAEHGGALPASDLDRVTVGGTSWGYNGVSTLRRKAQYVRQNGYAGVMVWQLAQDRFAAGGSDQHSLLPALRATLNTPAGAAPPAVAQVYFSGSTWQPAFKQYLASQGLGSASYGFAVPGGAAQLSTLPWINLDQVSVTFTSDVALDASHLTVRGAVVENYEFDAGAFAYDSATHTATWKLANGQTFSGDRIRLALDADGIIDPTEAVPLDGDWINPVGAAAGGDAYPSGDGTPGGDFLFRVNLLPGDVNRNGTVLADDFSDVKKRFFKSTTNVGAGDSAYSDFHDVNGDGIILAFDFSEVKKRFFNRLPDAPPPLLYSFENSAEGFRPNGFPLPVVARDTVGATDGEGSLLFSMSQPETFTGALTQLVNQATLLDKTTESISFDLTIAPGDGEYTGSGFARLGIVYFGSIPAQNIFGIPVQTNAASERSVDLAPGTYHLNIPLVSTAGTPFRDAFGTGPGKLTDVTGFEFYINKTNDDALSVYIDNVRAVPGPFGGDPPVPAPAGAALAAIPPSSTRGAARPPRRGLMDRLG